MSKQPKSGVLFLRPLIFLAILVVGLLSLTQLYENPFGGQNSGVEPPPEFDRAAFNLSTELLSLKSHSKKNSSVVKVIDGDTLRLQDQTEVRYLGIDTPEKDSPFFEEASNEHRDLVEKKAVTVISPRGKSRDNYGRLLGVTCIALETKEGSKSTCVPFRLLSLGLAHIYVKDMSPLLETLLPYYQRAQNLAIQQKLGIWKRYRLNSKNEFMATRFRFHKKDCRHMQGRKKIEWISSLAAFQSGRSPCRTCRPALHP